MLPDINLLPKLEREQSYAYIISMIIFFISVTLLLVLAFFYWQTYEQKKQAENTLSELLAKKETLQLESIQFQAEKAGSLEEMIDYADTYIFPTSVLLAELNTHLPQNGYLQSYEYDFSHAKLNLHLETMTEVSQYLSELEHSPYIKKVDLEKMETFELETDVYNEGETQYDVQPRYDTTYSISVNRSELKKAMEDE